MKILKRLLLVIGFLPVCVIAFIRWILTGKSATGMITRFEEIGEDEEGKG